MMGDGALLWLLDTPPCGRHSKRRVMGNGRWMRKVGDGALLWLLDTPPFGWQSDGCGKMGAGRWRLGWYVIELLDTPVFGRHSKWWVMGNGRWMLDVG